MNYDELCVKIIIANVLSFALFYVRGKLPLLENKAGFRIIVGPFSLRAAITAGILAGLLYSLPGLIIIAFFWEAVPEKARKTWSLLIWNIIVIILSLISYAIMGYVYESTHAWLVYSNEPPTRVFRYTMIFVVPFILVSIIGSLAVLGLEYAIRRVITSYGVTKPRKSSANRESDKSNKEGG